jgi:hypothetical protein
VSKKLLPPKYFPVPVRVLFNAEIPAEVGMTLIQLMSLSWNQPNHQTPPISYALLSSLTGKPVSTRRGHVAALRTKFCALQSQRPADGQITFLFSESLFAPGVDEIPSMPFKEEDPDPLNSDSKKLTPKNPPPDLLDQGGEIPSKPGRSRLPGKGRAAKPRPCSAAGRLSPAFLQELQQAGVFDGMLEEIASSGCSEAQLRTLLLQIREENPRSVAGLFCHRVREGQVPAEEEVCQVCGLAGGMHTPDCNQKYFSGPYGQWMDH